jgi:hypothetical protein
VSRGSSVSLVSSYRLEDWAIEVRWDSFSFRTCNYLAQVKENKHTRISVDINFKKKKSLEPQNTSYVKPETWDIANYYSHC